MPKRAHIDDTVDPTRAKLAEPASAPSRRQSEPEPAVEQPGAPVEAKGEGEQGSAPASAPAKPQSRGRNYLTVNRKVMISQDEAERFAEATRLISSSFGSRVTYSQVSRALWALTCGAEDAIREAARRAPNLTVPSKGDHAAMAEYEQALAEFLEVAIKRS